MTAQRLYGWPLALIAALFYTAGMGVVWLFAEHEYSETARLLQDVVVALGVLVLLTLALARWSGLGIHRSNRLGWYGIVALVPVALLLITFLLSARSGITDVGLVLTVLIGTALVGIGEETTFRGVVLNSLAERMSLPRALVVSSVLFGFWHVLPALEFHESSSTTDRLGNSWRAKVTTVGGQVLGTGLAGVGFCIVRLWSGSLLPSIALHASLNALGFALSWAFARRLRAL